MGTIIKRYERTYNSQRALKEGKINIVQNKWQ